MKKQAIIHLLQQNKDSLFPLLPGLERDDLMPLDLSRHSGLLQDVDLGDTASFHEVLFHQVLQGKVGIGGFFEDRDIYRRSRHFDGSEARSIHLGIDLWVAAGTALRSPLAGKIHSLQDNQGFGNYGPTIIVEHRLETETFFVLYGHLSRTSLSRWKPGNTVEAGAVIGAIGDFPENGDWPPHLHWQIMIEMLDYWGDFPGVTAPSERDFYDQLCIDPRLILTFD